jgi:hypothetical protein
MANITSNTSVAKPETAAQVSVLALCVTVGLAGLLLSAPHFRLAAQTAEVPSSSGHSGGLPLVWRAVVLPRATERACEKPNVGNDE